MTCMIHKRVCNLNVMKIGKDVVTGAANNSIMLNYLNKGIIKVMTTYYHYLNEYKNIYVENKNKTDWSLKFQKIVSALNRNASVIARETGFSDENVLEVIQDKSTPSFAMLADVVRYLHVNPDWLFVDERESVLKDNLRKRDSKEKIADRIKDLMNGSSKRSFAIKTGIHYQVLMKSLNTNEESEASEFVIRKIADACSVGFEWLLCGDENTREDPCNDQMIMSLNARSDVRKQIFMKLPDVEIQNTEHVYSLLERAEIYDKKIAEDISDKRSIGYRIKSIRSAYQCSLRDFAMMTGVSKSSVSNWENGRNKPDDFALRRISESLNIGKDWILYGDQSAMYWPCDKRMVEFLKEEPDIRKECYIALSSVS